MNHPFYIKILLLESERESGREKNERESARAREWKVREREAHSEEEAAAHALFAQSDQYIQELKASYTSSLRPRTLVA